MSIKNRKNPSAINFFIVLLSSLFISETLIMLLMSKLPAMTEWHEAFIDASLLVTINFPLIYYFYFLPLIRFTNLANTNSDALVAKNQALEIEVNINKLQAESLALLMADRKKIDAERERLLKILNEASDFIPKPINPVQMLEKIQQNLIPQSNV